MNLAKKIYKKFAGSILLGALCLVSVVPQSCTEDIDKSNRYTFTGETVVDYLEARPDSFSDFLAILGKAKIGRGGSVKHLMGTWGRYTCFAPTNEAVQLYVKEQYEKYIADSTALANGEMDSVDFHDTGIHSPYFEDLTLDKCKEIATNHIIEDEIYHTFDLSGSSFPTPSMSDRYVSYNFVGDSLTGAVSLKLNDASTCVLPDVDVENGVVHVLDRVLNPSRALGPDLLKSYEDSAFSIFSKALFETGLDKRIRETSYNMEEMEEKYSWEYGQLRTRLFQNSSGTAKCKVPETHYIKYTILAIPDSVLMREPYNIKSSEDLMAFAKKWYGDKYVEGETKVTDPEHPLYRLMAYHIIDRQLQLSSGFVQDNVNHDGYDSEVCNGAQYGFDRYDYYETLLDNGKTIKCTKPYNANAKPENLHQILLNYSQDNGADVEYRGEKFDYVNIRVLPVDSFKAVIGRDFEFKQEALNAIIHPINGILVYNNDVMAGNILKERIRINFTAFFPEFTNNNIRWARAYESGVYEYRVIPDGYCKRIKFNAEGSEMYYLYCKTVNEGGWSDYQGDEVITSGPYDFEYRLPHVPAGTYELRLGYSPHDTRGIAQPYLDGKVTGIPIDLRRESNSEVVKERFAFKTDAQLENDPDLIDADDKARRNRGYMKAPASAFTSSGIPLRNCHAAARIILGKFYLTDGDHWIRFKNTVEDNTTEFMHNYLEMVPNVVMSDPSKPEDKY